MTPVSMGPHYDVERYPCPMCGERALVYDGSVRYRSGERPPRSCATKEEIGLTPRADYDTAHYFHCARCGVLLLDPVDSHDQPYLHVEREAGSPG